MYACTCVCILSLLHLLYVRMYKYPAIVLISTHIIFMHRVGTAKCCGRICEKDRPQAHTSFIIILFARTVMQ